MSYIIEYQYHNNPIQALELQSLPDSEQDLRIMISKMIEETAYTPLNPEGFHALNAKFIEIIRTRKKP